MVSNRRNYYRLLQVQPDAPAEVIKAAYRALMTLHHPDRGGDHATAVLINEAFAVLSDGDRRAAYDAARGARAARSALRKDGASSGTAPQPTSHPLDDHCCPMCAQPFRTLARHDARCTRCSAPLVRVVRPEGTSRSSERRGIPRVSKTDWGLLHLDWQSVPIDVRMRDLSLDGISLYSGLPVPAQQRIRVVNRNFDVVADVVTCRRMNNVFTLHARLITAIFATPAGGFVSTMA